MPYPPFLAANNFEAWAEVVFLVIMGFLWLINRISTVVETARRPPPARRPLQPVPPPPADGPQQARPQQAPPMPPRQRVAPQGQPRTASDALQGEIDEFLRRATGRRDTVQQSGQAQRQRPPARPAVSGTKSDPRRGRGTPVVVRTKQAAPTSTEPLETPEAISEHVKQFLNTSEFDQRRESLSSIDEKERQFDQKVQQAFAHELGHLKPSTLADGGDSAATAAALSPIPANLHVLANLFRSGVDLQRAIALNEIFQRPDHRW